MKRTGRGFSLVEVLVVMAIMGIMASVALPLASLARQRQKEDELRQSLRLIRSAIDAYKLAADDGHVSRPAGTPGFPPSLAALVTGVEDNQSPAREKIYFLRRLPADPFYDGDPLPSGATAGAVTWKLRSYASSAADPKPGEDVYDISSTSDAVALDGTKYSDW